MIDSHVHIGLTEKLNRSFTFESYIDLMNKCLVAKSVVMPNLSSVTKTSVLNNIFIEEYYKLTDEQRNRFLPFLVIDPNDNETYYQIDEHIIYGAKYHPSISTMQINKPPLKRFLEKLEVMQIPLLVHCGRNAKSHVMFVIECAEIYPHLNFIAAHMGGNASDLVAEAIELICQYKLDNLYLDTSAVKVPWLIEEGVRKIGVKKILFGSDEPYSDLRIGKYSIELCNLTQDEKNDIFFNNVIELLGVYK